MNTLPGRLDQYELQELLGQSGLTEVWKAFDNRSHRFVAIKLLRAQLQADPDFASRFQQVAQSLVSLHHPNIVQLYDFSIPQLAASGATTAYLVMEYVDGGTLVDYIRTTARAGKFLSPAQLVQLFTPIGKALDYAYQHGVIHGQLKPANILLDKRGSSRNAMGEPKVSDFSILKLLGTTAGSTSGWSIGTPLYTSPEQIMGSPPNERSDIYSLGAILYEICTGTPPFTGNNPATIIMQHLNATPISPALINPNLPPPLTAIIMRCLTKDPTARFPTVSSLIETLTREFGREEAAEYSTVITPGNVNQLPGSPEETDSPTVLTDGQFSPRAGMTPVGFTPSQPGISSGTFPAPSSPAITPVNPLTPAPPAQPTQRMATGSMGQLPPPSMPLPQRRSRRGLWMVLAALLILALIGSGLAAYFTFFSKPASSSAAPTIVGHAFFVSSGLLSANQESSQGITDQLQIKLDNIPPPQSGKSYYAWLLNDITLSSSAILLGPLTLKNGSTSLMFPGDSQHTNLLATNSRLLITEENTSPPPVNPSLDPTTYRYYAEFSQIRPDPHNPTSYSVYDHIRHLLANDPKVQAAGLTGGLDIWLYRNTQKILEWAGSARDAWNYRDSGLIHRQLIRILDYLDGLTYAQQDLPGQNVQSVLSDPTIAKIGLLTFDPEKQNPPGYLYHIGKHLRELTQLPQTSPAQTTLANQINLEINQVTVWFNAIRNNVLQLFAMNNTQLFSDNGRSLLDSVASYANYAFVGQVNPQAQVSVGVVQIHYDIQRLATFDVRECTSNQPCSI